MKVRLRTVVLVLIALGGLAIAGGALFVYAGVYNIAATRQHTQPVFQLLEYAMRRSVAVRTEAEPIPDIADRQRILAGARVYRGHCLQCHGAPGVAPHALAYGMTPEPVNLASTARDWPARDVYWVVRHGIKMSGMPAWDTRLTDEEMWNVVAFVMAMPAMSPVEYAAIDPTVEIRVQHPLETEGAGPPLGPAPMPESEPDPVPAKIGDVEAGRQAIGQYLCATCHQIPGVTGAHRHVGPPLTGIATRRYIAGIALNTPENMVRWLRNPQEMDPLSAMPDLGVSEEDARDIAAYLYTLEDLE